MIETKLHFALSACGLCRLGEQQLWGSGDVNLYFPNLKCAPMSVPIASWSDGFSSVTGEHSIPGENRMLSRFDCADQPSPTQPSPTQPSPTQPSPTQPSPSLAQYLRRLRRASFPQLRAISNSGSNPSLGKEGHTIEAPVRTKQRKFSLRICLRIN